jgi:hypothetical protein
MDIFWRFQTRLPCHRYTHTKTPVPTYGTGAYYRARAYTLPLPPHRVHKKTSLPGSIPVPLQRGHVFLLLSTATTRHTEPLTVTSRLVPAATTVTTRSIAKILSHYCQPLPPQDEQATVRTCPSRPTSSAVPLPPQRPQVSRAMC